MSERSVYGENEGEYSFDLNYQDFTADSITLSGIFRPATFFDPPSSVVEGPPPNALAIYSSNGSIACSFDVAEHERNLEMYSPLGIKAASLTIPPNQVEASLPRLPSGFYFVRLDGSVRKMFVAE